MISISIHSLFSYFFVLFRGKWLYWPQIAALLDVMRQVI